MAVLQAVTDCWREPLEDDGTVVVLAVTDVATYNEASGEYHQMVEQAYMQGAAGCATRTGRRSGSSTSQARSRSTAGSSTCRSGAPSSPSRARLSS
jgi:hypothetical protein